MKSNKKAVTDQMLMNVIIIVLTVVSIIFILLPIIVILLNSTSHFSDKNAILLFSTIVSIIRNPQLSSSSHYDILLPLQKMNNYVISSQNKTNSDYSILKIYQGSNYEVKEQSFDNIYFHNRYIRLCSSKCFLNISMNKTKKGIMVFDFNIVRCKK